jgi:putative endonuclease
MKTTTTSASDTATNTMWYVYMVECADATFYTGVTTDVTRRVHEHNNSVKGAKYTRCRRPVTLAYSEESDSRQNACRREYIIRKLRASHKTDLAQLFLQNQSLG